MALKACRDCATLISTDANNCPNCGAKVLRTRWWLWALMAPAALFVAAMITAPSAPKTYSELSAQRKADCIRNKGDGGWRASSGRSLEMWCGFKANVETMDELCKAHPETC